MNSHALNIADLSPEAVEQINALTINEGENARASLTDIKRNVATAKPEDKLKTFILNAGLIAAYARDGLLDAGECSRELSAVADANDLEKNFGEEAVREAIAKAESRMIPSAWRDGPDNEPFSIAPGYSEEIERLAALGAVEYDRERKTSSLKLGIRPATLDKVVIAARAKLKEQNPGDDPGAFKLPEAEMWPEPVNGAELLSDIVKEIRSYVIMGEHEANTAALWVLHTYGLDRFFISPRLAVSSPEKGCGKSTMKDCLTHLVCRPMAADNVSAAVLYYVAERMRPTFLLDEADSFIKDNEDLRNVLNSGHRRNGAVARMEKKADGGMEPINLRTWCATAFFLIGELPVTVQDRSIVVSLRRRAQHETIKPYDPEDTQDLNNLASRAARWMNDNLDAVVSVRPTMPGIYNRAADNWKPLVRIATVAGGDWPELAKKAYQAATSGDERQTMRVALLEDIREIFANRGTEILRSAEICDALASLEERPWPEFNRGKPITPNGLARLLRPFAIVSGNHRGPAGVTKGYNLAHFSDAFTRYLPVKGDPNRYSATSLQPQGFPAHSEPLHNVECSGPETGQLAPNDGPCSVVAVAKPETEAFEEIPL